MAVFNNYGYGGGLFGLGGSQGAYYGGGMGDGVFTGNLGLGGYGGGPQPIGIGQEILMQNGGGGGGGSSVSVGTGGGVVTPPVDVIINKNNGKKKFMLSQSFMIDPSMGDEQHILLNPKTGNVWYDLSNKIIHTPEWTMKPEIIRFN